MTTTMILLGGPALLALLGYLAATGRVADSRDGRDWKRGTAPAGTPSRATGDSTEAAPAEQATAGRRTFTARQVELIAVTDRDGRDSVLSR